MNLEDKKSVTRNGVKYPVMWVWDEGISKMLSIVIHQEQNLVIAVDDGNEGDFCSGEDANFVNWERCAPQNEPTYRPYNDDEMKRLVGEILVRKLDANYMLIIAADGIGIWFGLNRIKPDKLLDEWTHKDGSPCGVEEES